MANIKDITEKDLLCVVIGEINELRLQVSSIKEKVDYFCSEERMDQIAERSRQLIREFQLNENN